MIYLAVFAIPGWFKDVFAAEIHCTVGDKSGIIQITSLEGTQTMTMSNANKETDTVRLNIDTDDMLHAEYQGQKTEAHMGSAFSTLNLRDVGLACSRKW